MKFSGWISQALGLTTTPKRFTLEGSFTCNGAAAATSPKAAGYSVRRTGTGTYVVTFDRPFRALVSCNVTLQQATAGNDCAFLVSSTLGSASAGATLTIETQSVAGTAANLAAGTVHFQAIFTDATLSAPASTSV